jgi:hypothetical protein
MFSISKGTSWIQFGHNKVYNGDEFHIALFNTGFSISFDMKVLSWNFFIWKWNLSFYINSLGERGKIFTIFYKHDDKEKVQLF